MGVVGVAQGQNTVPGTVGLGRARAEAGRAGDYRIPSVAAAEPYPGSGAVHGKKPPRVGETVTRL